ncbi:LysM peptidoglycan-binding domain-containing protein [Niallia sp. Krafla_26]|uniref:LysM peptidoglycan-binding domain-containing protein n=1 Tax=Niallia sp. Krafla_26 TaxID=3064703 RepID=UPI003D16ADE0
MKGIDMKKYLVVVFVCIILLFITEIPATAFQNMDSNLYVVKQGDTLPAIAKKYETTVEELIRSNGLQSEALLVGQKLRIPIYYEIEPGDTLKELASRFRSTVELIKESNSLSNDKLIAGQVIFIPPKKLMMDGQHILLTKEEFADWLFNHQFKRNISLIQEHHTFLPSYKHFHGNNHIKMLKSMEHFHKSKQGWNNIAQNLTTFPDGKVAISRPFDSAPEGSIGSKANSVGIAIENVGNFDVGHDVMTKEQHDTIVYITALLCLKFGLTPSVDSITYHHWWHYKTGERVLDNTPEYNVKSCPGTGFFGGNSTASAKNYFYPLVLKRMEEIKANRE